MPQHRFSVAETEQGMRLDRFLVARLPAEAQLSRARLAKLIEQGCASIEGEPATRRSLPLRTGQAVGLSVPSGEVSNLKSHAPSSPPSSPPSSSAPALEILYEDAHLLCFVKPAALTTHPAPSVREETLVARLIAHCAPHLAGYPHDERCGIVHRLDKDTSGVMVAAKDDQTRLILASMFARHDLERRYLTLVWGVPMLKTGTIDAAIARHPVQRTRMAIHRDSRQGAVVGGDKEGKEGRRAVTHYAVVETFAQHASLLRCRLETGRTHQIRVHLASIGCHVMGDPLYRDSNPCAQRRKIAAQLPARSLKRQALHAEHLAFSHPIDNTALCVEAPPPRDFLDLLEGLRQLSRANQTAATKCLQLNT